MSNNNVPLLSLIIIWLRELSVRNQGIASFKADLKKRIVGKTKYVVLIHSWCAKKISHSFLVSDPMTSKIKLLGRVTPRWAHCYSSSQWVGRAGLGLVGCYVCRHSWSLRSLPPSSSCVGTGLLPLWVVHPGSFPGSHIPRGHEKEPQGLLRHPPGAPHSLPGEQSLGHCQSQGETRFGGGGDEMEPLLNGRGNSITFERGVPTRWEEIPDRCLLTIQLNSSLINIDVHSEAVLLTEEFGHRYTDGS